MELITAQIRRLDDADAIASAWPVVHQLRPHLDRAALLDAWACQRAEGFRAAGLFVDGVCRVFAGYRVQHMLAHGRFLYVDDLVCDEAVRGTGLGTQMIDWLLAEARREGCASLQLDSGTQRLGAHAFYFARGLHINSFHFRIPLPA